MRLRIEKRKRGSYKQRLNNRKRNKETKREVKEIRESGRIVDIRESGRIV